MANTKRTPPAKRTGRPASGAKPKSSRKTTDPRKSPRGGLTAKGREHFKKTEGAHLKPGVKGKADTPEKQRRKGSFLRRHFANPSGPMVDEKGEPTRLALSAQAWGEKVPKNDRDAKRLADKGSKLLEQYKSAKPRAKSTARSKSTAKSKK